MDGPNLQRGSSLVAEPKMTRALHRWKLEWRPINMAPKNLTSILIILKNPIPCPDRDDLRRWDGLQIVARHPGLAEDGFDIGWNVAAPVGHGGFPDDWIAGWMPLPEPPK